MSAALDAVAIQHTACAPWVQTHTGLALDLESPDPRHIHQHDIAVTLARLPRFTGHTIDVFSVAQHSVLVLRILDAMWAECGQAAPAELRLAALLHDAHEAYMGDISSPVASLPGLTAPIAQLKARLQRAIHRRFGLPETPPEEWRKTIKLADMVALATEKRDLMGPEPLPWVDLPEPFEQRLDLGYRYWLARDFTPTLTALAAEVVS